MIAHIYRRFIMCGLEAILACFSLSGIYFDANYQYINHGYGEISSFKTSESLVYTDLYHFSKRDQTYNVFKDQYFISRKSQSLSLLTIGYEIELNKSRVYLSISREFTNSTTSASLGFSYHPFKAGR